MAKAKARRQKTKLNLALQGGGTHGAYTWGVLDRLLEEKDIEINAISGTSAGAMNAAILATGFAKGGAAKAREMLELFWRDISFAGMAAMPFMTPLDYLTGNHNLKNSVLYGAFEALTRVASPYELNPLNINPLRIILERHVDRAALAASEIELFVSATAVRTGQARIFTCKEVTPDALLASSCLPFLFQAVEIDGEPYWDGGYMGNPVIWPLIYKTPVSDVLLVQINPLYREELPKTAYDIANRLNEINFNSSLMAEMRAINFVAKLVHDNKLDPKRYRALRMHMVAASEVLHDLDASSKMNANWDFLQYLRDQGRAQMDKWLVANKKQIGIRQTIDIEDTFLKKHVPEAGTKRRRAA
ncbi:MAG: patatin-like phospholipase family protein [Alphaproteobacteria bacterium]|nr:patatin-like phospholipase family protein [Alphaproteobacteria bacterium]